MWKNREPITFYLIMRCYNETFGQRCRVIFDQVVPQLIADHYDWSIIIEPDSGDYFIDPDNVKLEGGG